MFKTMTFLKRRAGMSLEDFQRYYEERHAPLGKKLMRQARRYVRRYVTPAPYPMTGEVPEADFDVITEVWCDDRAAYEAMLADLMKPETMAIIVEDERNFVDQSKTKLFFVEERESRTE